jgi:serine protease AprX
VQTFNIANPDEVKETNGLLSSTSLGANYPNPFSSSTTIPFTIGERGFVTLEVLDPLGRSCAVLASGNYNAGGYEVKFNGEHFTAGAYFVRLKTEKQSFTKILELVK